MNVGSVERAVSIAAGGLLALLGIERRSVPGALAALVGGALVYRGATGHCHGYASLGLDSVDHNDATVIPAQQGCKVEKSFTINRTPAELYGFWREVENLPKVMTHLEKVESLDRGRSHWVAWGPFGKRVEWDAEIHNLQPGEMIAWRSIPGSDLDTAGSIHFKPAADERRTIVTLNMKYDPPAGKVGSTIAAWLGQSVEGELEQGLRRFKQIAEAGEIACVAGQPRGTCR